MLTIFKNKTKLKIHFHTKVTFTTPFLTLPPSPTVWPSLYMSLAHVFRAPFYLKQLIKLSSNRGGSPSQRNPGASC